MKIEIVWDNQVETFDMRTTKYENGRLAIVAYDELGALFGKLTVNVPDVKLAENEVVVKTYSENEPWAMQAVRAMVGKLVPTGRIVPVGRTSCPVYRLDGEL